MLNVINILGKERKLRKKAALFIVTSLIVLSCQVTTTAFADAVTNTTTANIIFTSGQSEPEDPPLPNPNQPIPSQDNQAILPSTGEQMQYIHFLAGLVGYAIILIFAILFVVYRKRRENNEEI